VRILRGDLTRTGAGWLTLAQARQRIGKLLQFLCHLPSPKRTAGASLPVLHASLPPSISRSGERQWILTPNLADFRERSCAQPTTSHFRVKSSTARLVETDSRARKTSASPTSPWLSGTAQWMYPIRRAADGRSTLPERIRRAAPAAAEISPAREFCGVTAAEEGPRRWRRGKSCARWTGAGPFRIQEDRQLPRAGDGPLSPPAEAAIRAHIAVLEAHRTWTCLQLRPRSAARCSHASIPTTQGTPLREEQTARSDH
jgi:hypothetical protein